MMISQNYCPFYLVLLFYQFLLEKQLREKNGLSKEQMFSKWLIACYHFLKGSMCRERFDNYIKDVHFWKIENEKKVLHFQMRYDYNLTEYSLRIIPQFFWDIDVAFCF